jgi:sortase A
MVRRIRAQAGASANVATVSAGAQPDALVPAGGPAGTARPALPGEPGSRRAGPGPLRMIGTSVGLAVLLVVGFFVYLFGLSHVSQERAQAAMFKNFVGELALGTAPVAPTTPVASTTTSDSGAVVPLAEGAPVAVLNIPQIGLRDVVVVEGTTSRDLALGPGHVPASALPGQTGVSFIYGKAVTYGAPFAHLMRLNRGDRFTVTTGQGTATYVVESFGTSVKPAPADADNRLVLETAAASFLPNSAVQVSADLVSAPQPNPDDWPAITAQESDMARDTSDSLVPLLLWSQALLLAVIVATFAAHRWSRWGTYLLMTPVVMALLWCVYENLACLLPNLY